MLKRYVIASLVNSLNSFYLGACFFIVFFFVFFLNGPILSTDLFISKLGRLVILK